jgi:hypothetical protein
MGEILMAAEKGAPAEACATAAEEQSTLPGRIGEVCAGDEARRTLSSVCRGVLVVALIENIDIIVEFN